MNKYIIAFTIACLSLGINAQGIVFENIGWQEVKKKADSLNLPIFLDIYTDWCKPCQWMTERVFPDQKVGDYFNPNFINYKINAEQAVGRILAHKYNVKGYPTMLFVDKRGREMYRLIGYRSPEELIREAQVVIQPGVIPKLELFERKYSSGNRDKRFLTDYVKLKTLTLNQPITDLFDSWYNELSLIDFLDTTTMILLIQALPNAATKAYATAMDFYNPNSLKEEQMDSVLLDKMSFRMHMALTTSIDKCMKEHDIKSFNKMLKYNESLYLKEHDSISVAFSNDLRQTKMEFHFIGKNSQEFGSLAKSYVRDELIVFEIPSMKLDSTTGDTIQVLGYNFQFERSSDEDKNGAIRLHQIAEKYYKLLPKDARTNLSWVEAAIHLDNNTDFYSLYGYLLNDSGQRKNAISVLRKAMSRAKREKKNFDQLSETMTDIMKK